MCMLCLDTSLKAIHNILRERQRRKRNVYAMFRYKFESNSQRLRRIGHLCDNVYAMFRYKFESNSQRGSLRLADDANVYAMFRYKFESNSGSQRTQLQMYE